jgi:hypothetical protein
MAGSLSAHTAGGAQDAGDEATYTITGTGTSNDGKRVRGVAQVDPTTGLPGSPGGGGGGGGAVTVADGADVAEGGVGDAIVAPGAVGTNSAKLRRATQGLEDLKSLIVLAAGTNIIGKVGLDKQKSATDVLQNAVTGNVALGAAPNGSTDGYETLLLSIANGAGTATVTVKGSLDATFASAQDALTLGVVLLSDSTNGANTSRSVVSGALAVAANTTYLYQIVDTPPNVRAVVSSASGLGAGTTDTGLTVSLYKMAV